MKVDNKIVMRSILYIAGNNFSLFTGYKINIVSLVQMLLLVGQLTNWIGHNLLTDSTLKKVTQNAPVRCWLIMFDHDVKMAEH